MVRGGDELYENHFIFNPYGRGWHLDRQRFDTMLAEAARLAGARICCGARVRSCLPLAAPAQKGEGPENAYDACTLVDAWSTDMSSHGSIASAGTAALGEYDRRASEVFRECLRLRAVYYGREQRWPQSVFWHRRQAVAVTTHVFTS